MKETHEFAIRRHETPHPHYDLVLVNPDGPRHWIVPGEIPEKYKEMRISIEQGSEPSAEYESENAELRQDSYGEGMSELWDSGTYESEIHKSTKLVIELHGGKRRGKFLLFCPIWGRWTKKRLWILEKIKDS
jgi:bifunctional non-homologous end joining protein LigD